MVSRAEVNWQRDKFKQEVVQPMSGVNTHKDFKAGLRPYDKQRDVGATSPDGPRAWVDIETKAVIPGARPPLPHAAARHGSTLGATPRPQARQSLGRATRAIADSTCRRLASTRSGRR